MDEVDSVSVLPKYENTEVSLSKNGKNVDTTIFEKLNNETIGEQNIKTRLYYRRFFILIIFCLYSMSSAFQWIEYAIIMDIIMKYYNTSELAVTWTSMIYMLSYIPLVFVATWMLDNWGLRRILLLGATLNAVGSLIKIGSVAPHLFAVSFVGAYYLYHFYALVRLLVIAVQTCHKNIPVHVFCGCHLGNSHLKKLLMQ